jgi:zinc protease
MTDKNRTPFLAFLAATGLAIAAGAPAQEPERAKETPPAGSTPQDFTLPDKQETRLDNGLEITAVPFGSVPKATVAVVVRTGNLNEGEQTWLADLTGDFLLEGTAGRAAEAIAREAAAMGGEVNVTVGEDTTTISADALSEFAPKMAVLLADIVRNASFPESELDRLRRDRLRQLSVAAADPQQMAYAAFREALYADHPYGRVLPTAEQLSSYTIEDVRGFHAKNFGAQRTHVFVSGKFDVDRTMAAIEEAFADWKQGPEALVNVPEPAEGKVATQVIDRPDASQSNIWLGLPTINPGHEDWIALDVTDTLLGGFFSSRITSNIREDKGYTYSPGSTLSSRYRDGYWAEIAAVTTDVTGPAIKEILGEIDELQANPPPAEELDGVKNYSAGVFVLQNSTRNGIIGVLSYLDLHDLPDAYLTNYVSNVFAVTPEQVSEMARQYLRDEDMTLVVVGDRSKVSEQVAPYLGAAPE